MSKVDLLVIGGSGFIGSHLVKAVANEGYSVAYTYNENNPHLPGQSYQIALDQENKLEECIEKNRPRIILYCAKPKLSSEESLHYKVNVEGVRRVLASINYSNNVLFVYLSTSAVFSGKAGPYTESSKPDPEERTSHKAYALTKSEGEKVALGNWSNTIVVRLSRVNGRDIHGNLNHRISGPLNQLLSGKTLSRYCDRYISPILVNNLRDGLIEIMDPNFSYRGILNFAGRQRLTDYDYWLCIARHAGIEEDLIVRDFLLSSTANKTGADNSLDTAFTQLQLSTRFLNVDEQLSLIFPSKGGC